MTKQCKTCKLDNCIIRNTNEERQLSFLFDTDIHLTERKEKMTKGFIIKVTENEPKLYLKKLLDLLKKTTLTIEPNTYPYTGPSKAKKGDYIAVNTELNEDFNVELLGPSSIWFSNYNSYNLVLDFSTIEKMLEKYMKRTNNCVGCPFYEFTNLVLGMDTLSKSSFRNNESHRTYDGEWFTLDAKITFFTDFVKIGYDIYEIYGYGNNKYIVFEGDRIRIGKNWNGRRYLLV